MFNIDFQKLVTYLLPVRMRSAIMQAWINVLVNPTVYLYNLFLANRTTNLYRLQHNGQVVYLQAAVNDVFDNALRRIIITDKPYADAVPVYVVAELKPLALYTTAENKPIALYTATEVAGSTAGFIVNVPSGVSTFNMAYMKALINKYRLPGMYNYSIVIV